MIHQKALDKIQLLQLQPLFAVTRSADMGCFEFGEGRIRRTNHKGEVRACSEYAIHLQCPFRLVSKRGEILFTAYDMYLSHTGERLEELSWDVPGANLFDKVTKAWLDANPNLYVMSVFMTPLGDLRILFSNDDYLEVFVNQSANVSADDECWRFFERDSEKAHLVISGRGDDF